MGLRFHKSIKLLQGVKLNLSKTGTSISVGGKGLTFNIGKKGAKTTVGLPRSGFSYSSYSPFFLLFGAAVLLGYLVYNSL